MIDTDKYEGHDNWEGTKVNMANEANKLLIADAPLLLEEVKRLSNLMEIYMDFYEFMCEIHDEIVEEYEEGEEE